MNLPNELARLFDTSTLPAIVVHGGAGNGTRSPSEPLAKGAAEAAEVGFEVLRKGGSALDAVEAAVVFLEEFPLFNAGRGSCLTADGTVEMDASIMDGRNLEAGAVASVRGVRSPIRLARRVMSDTDHLLLAGEGAERFAREIGAAFEPEEWFITPEQRARYEELLEEVKARPLSNSEKLGTVGAVAVDSQGNVAAATSTGGTILKRPGRVGDTPIIGAGTWADNEAGGISCTGHGESIIRTTLARWTADRMEEGLSPQQAAERAAAHLRQRVDGDGGLIVVAPDGRVGWAMNTLRMSRGFMRAGMGEAAGFVDR